MRFLLITSIFISSLSFGIDSQYIYTDGNNNTYSLRGDTLNYYPVKKINSSSGQYDGGDSKSIQLDKDQIEKLIDLFNLTLNNIDIHQKKREMGCGTLVVIESKNEQRIYIKRNAQEKIQMEQYLKELFEN